MATTMNPHMTSHRQSVANEHAHNAELTAEIAEQLDGGAVDLKPRPLMHLILGRPLETAAAPHQTIGKAVGLAVFASDALSSVAYATQEILLVLALAGAAAFHNVFAISVAI